MNERIRELAKEALNYAEKNQSAEVQQHWFKLYNEKFAELIVKECSYLADQAHKKATGVNLPVVILENISELEVECMCGICKLGKREWVGLTDEEIGEVISGQFAERNYWVKITKALESKIKEKNHG